MDLTFVEMLPSVAFLDFFCQIFCSFMSVIFICLLPSKVAAQIFNHRYAEKYFFIPDIHLIFVNFLDSYAITAFVFDYSTLNLFVFTYFCFCFHGNTMFSCLPGGDATVEDIGIEINSYDMEISVLVCNIEVDTADCYTALPTDVTGMEYYTVSMPSANDASELMIIAQADGTTVDITIPTGSGHSVTYNGATTTAGGVVQVSLNKGQTFCLAQTTANADTSHVTGYHISSNNPVSVISGNRKYENDHMVDQMPPITKLDTHYVLVPADPVSDDRATTYVVQAVESGRLCLYCIALFLRLYKSKN